MDSSEDLPLSANYSQFQVRHYSLDLHCSLRSKTFAGEVTLELGQGPDWDGDSDVVLDCSDLHVKSVEILRGSEATEVSYSVNSWSMKICLPSPIDWRRRLRLRISYKTRPDSRSLHWRQDSEGTCVYTAAASINNRGLFPCQVRSSIEALAHPLIYLQDIPKALSTWSARISLDAEYRDWSVFCTGESEAVVEETGDLRSYLYQHTSFSLPMSTFAIAVGRWTVRDIDSHQPRIRFIGPKPLVENNFHAVNRYLPHCLSAAQDLLGRYPLPRIDVVMVHRSFSGLGLASPHLLFLSPSLMAGDRSLFIKISHEISHAWFGIMIGSLDWTEAWISEGFATFLEEIIHDSTLLLLEQEVPASLAPLRALIKLESLQEEVGNTAEELQLLQPMRGSWSRDLVINITTCFLIIRERIRRQWPEVREKWTEPCCRPDSGSLPQGLLPPPLPHGDLSQ